MNSYYLMLDLNLPQKKEVVKLKHKLGYSGFGLYIAILIYLSQQDEYMGELDYDSLAFELRVDSEHLKSVINEYNLFVISNDKFYSKYVNEKMKSLEEAKEKKRQAGIKSGEARRAKSNSVRTVFKHRSNGVPKNTEHNIIEEDIKEDNIKGNNITKNKDKIKEKENKLKAKEILSLYNQTYNLNLKSTKGWFNNFCYWLEDYDIETIKSVILKLTNKGWWPNRKSDQIPPLDFLFRTRNKSGNCDYISELLALKENKRSQQIEEYTQGEIQL